MLYPDINFRILHSYYDEDGSPCCVPESVFSFDISKEELKKLDGKLSLRRKVEPASRAMFGAYSAILRRMNECEDPFLDYVLPFIYGEDMDIKTRKWVVSAVPQVIKF